MRCAFELEGENLYSIKWFQVIRNIVVECPTQLTVDNWICSMTNISDNDEDDSDDSDVDYSKAD